MSSAIKTKKRIINAVIAVLVIALAVTGGAYLIAGSISDASAAEETDISNEADPANAVETGAVKDAPEAAGSDGSEARIMETLTPGKVTVDGEPAAEKTPIAITATAVSKPYDGNTNITVNFAITEKPENCDVALSNDSTTGTASSPNAGTVTVEYDLPELTGSDAENVTLEPVPASGVLTAEITKASVGEVTFPSGGRLQFGHSLEDVTFDVPGKYDTVDGEFIYEDAKSIVPDRLGVFDGYYLEFIPNDPVNYESKKQIVAFTVEELRVDFAVTINGVMRPGNTLTLSYNEPYDNFPSLVVNEFRYQWYRIDPNGKESPARIDGATGDTYQVQTGDVGYTIAVVVYLDKGEGRVVFANTETLDNNENSADDYEGIVGRSSEVVEKAQPSFWQTLLDWLYKIISAISNLVLGLRK